jgi:hypothetical protein
VRRQKAPRPPGSIRRPLRAEALSDAWRAWVAENALLGVQREVLLDTLAGQGVPRAVALRELEVILSSPILRGARRAARRARRYQLLERLERETALLAGAPMTVERRSRLSAEELHERYYASGTPVVITDVLEPWPAVSRWSPAYFKERFGDVEVLVTTGRGADPAADAHYREHSTPVRFGDFCDLVERSGPTNDFYLIANNLNSEKEELAPLLGDLGASHPYLRDERSGNRVLFWFGPAGTVTPLHYDTRNVLFCQVFGRKKVTLYPRFEASLTDELHDFVYSSVDPERPDLDAFPELEHVRHYEVVLGRGEGLFMPVGCFHHVRALEPSMSVAFTNFRDANDFAWYYPARYA